MRHIACGKMESMQRVYIMLSEILRLQVAGDAAAVAAQTVQSMKAIHQFAVDNIWRTAWPLTFLPDPLTRRRLGGTEAEVEAVVGRRVWWERIPRPWSARQSMRR